MTSVESLGTSTEMEEQYEKQEVFEGEFFYFPPLKEKIKAKKAEETRKKEWK